MGFDQDRNDPVVQPQKQTTKINIVMVVAIIVFFIATAGVVLWEWRKAGGPERDAKPVTETTR